MMRIALYGQPTPAENYLDSIEKSDNFRLSGIKSYNGNQVNSKIISDNAIRVFKSEDELINQSDVILFLNFQTSQYFLLKRALKESKHVLVNPSTFISTEILNDIQKLGEEAGVLYYLRHKSLSGQIQAHLRSYYNGNAEFIDVYRYIPAGCERNKFLIQKIISREIMFVYSLNHHEIIKINLKTVPYCSDAPYIINIRFEFSNSSTVNLTINFYTDSNARYSELYYGDNMLRISSDNNKVEFVNRFKGKYTESREDFKLSDEDKLSDEIKTFLNLLSEKKYPVEFKNSGLAAHQTICNIVNEISETKKSEV